MASRGRGARSKGYGGEIEACVKLQAAFYPNGEGKVIRTPMSGAWHGMPILSGDVVFLDNDGKPDESIGFFVEVKRIARNSISPLAWLNGEFYILEKWLEQAWTASKRGTASTIPIVMWRTDFAPWFVLMQPNDVLVLRERFGLFPRYAPYFFCAKMGAPGVALMPFLSFIEWVIGGRK